jgi:hypothetical protein
MKFTSRVTVTGVKRSKGVLESGQAYDSTKVYVSTGLDDSKGNGSGSATVEYTWGTSDNFEKIAHLFKGGRAVEFDVDLEIVTNGKTQRTQVVDLRPVAAVKG